MIIFVVKNSKGFVEIMLALRRSGGPTLFHINGPMYRVIRVVVFRGIKRHLYAATLVQHWAGIGWVGLHCMYDVHRIDAYTDLLVNGTVRSEVKETRGSTFHWQILHGCWPAPAMVMEGIGLHVEIYLSPMIISWTFRILPHEENQYSYVYKILGRFFI